MVQKKYFRYHRSGFEESMKTMVEVNGLDDIRRIVEDDALIKGYYKNIRIGDGLVDHRCVPYGWGDTSYYVLADFGGYTGQCIGMANFKVQVIEVKLLHLPLKAKWYDMQESGEKPEEYREITPYWYQRLYQRKKEFGDAGRLTRDDAEYCCQPDLRYILKGDGFADTELKPYTHVCFHYGYTQRCFINPIDSITIGRGNPEWGAPTDRDVFIIRHHKEDVVVDGWVINQTHKKEEPRKYNLKV